MLLSQFSWQVCLALFSREVQGATIGRPSLARTDAAPKVQNRQADIVPYSLPSLNDQNRSASRIAAIAATRNGFLYGPSVAGGPYYPTGSIGNATILEDLATLEAELALETSLATEDVEDATVAYTTGAFETLSTLEDYERLYDNQWKNSLPKGPAPGIMSNYTQDLLFSMERLSTSPYALRRLIPGRDTLAFGVDDNTATAITGTTINELFEAGRLFYIDHSDQGSLEPAAAYSAACDAYFYIDERSDEFLPLAIRTGVGANLVYTPQDQPGDWLLAKIIFNGNDIFFTQFNHFAATHQVVQISWMAAIRTLSTEHPVYGILHRLMYQVFAVPPVARDVLLAPGKAVDAIFGYTGAAAEVFIDNLYNNGQGRFRSNYFLTDLKNRGLIDSPVGPKLANFPFFEDASVIYNAINDFMTTFVDSYYNSDWAVLVDVEVQAWVAEANGKAQVYDFPQTIRDKKSLVDALTHMAHLASTAHHAVNTNELASVSLTLPFHAVALSKPLPTTKGNTSVASYLPTFEKCSRQLYMAGVFARPVLVDTNRTLVNMFNDDGMLALMNENTKTAATTFQRTMQSFSEAVNARTFNSEGLSQGMPFVWQGLDPNVAPFSITI